MLSGQVSLCRRTYMCMLLILCDSITYFTHLHAEQNTLPGRVMTFLNVLFVRSLLLTIAVFRLATANEPLVCHAPTHEAFDFRDCQELLGSIHMSFDGNPNFREQFLTRPWKPSWKTCLIKIVLTHTAPTDPQVLRDTIYEGINHTIVHCLQNQGLGGVLTYNGVRVNVKRKRRTRRHDASHHRANKGQ